MKSLSISETIDLRVRSTFGTMIQKPLAYFCTDEMLLSEFRKSFNLTTVILSPLATFLIYPQIVKYLSRYLLFGMLNPEYYLPIEYTYKRVFPKKKLSQKSSFFCGESMRSIP